MKKLKATLLIMLLLTMVACAEVRAIRQSVGFYGADAADQALETALWTICNGSPVGAINRQFKTSTEIGAYRVLCQDNFAAPASDPNTQ